jgi:hypothetical protein
MKREVSGNEREVGSEGFEINKINPANGQD